MAGVWAEVVLEIWKEIDDLLGTENKDRLGDVGIWICKERVYKTRDEAPEPGWKKDGSKLRPEGEYAGTVFGRES